MTADQPSYILQQDSQSANEHVESSEEKMTKRGIDGPANSLGFLRGLVEVAKRIDPKNKE